jgi:hypothetical protein
MTNACLISSHCGFLYFKDNSNLVNDEIRAVVNFHTSVDDKNEWKNVLGHTKRCDDIE